MEKQVKKQDKVTEAAHYYINAKGAEKSIGKVSAKFNVSFSALDTRVFQIRTLQGWR